MTTLPHVPDTSGRFGRFGGRYVPETLLNALEQLEAAYATAIADRTFQSEVETLLREFVGRETPFAPAERLTALAGGGQVWLKREDLAHTGAHKINNAMGQIASRPAAWARRASSPRPARASTAWPPPPHARALDCSARCTWAPRMCGVRR